ncbi:MAG: hypothetical protein MK108_07670 [Mariniblastus sp.]|nr:hypothetical protein [Mariniblastus sp.]
MNSIYNDAPGDSDDPGNSPGPEGGPGSDPVQPDQASVYATQPGTQIAQVEPLEVTEIFPNPLPMPVNFQNLAAAGGSVGALVLGVWSIIGATLTPFSMINAIVGILMGFWGLTSTKKTMAIVGMVLCLIGLSLSVWEVNGFISNYFYRAEEM